MDLLLLGVPECTVFAALDNSWSRQGNVFQRMSQRSTTTVTDGHFSINFDDWDLVDEI